MDIQKKGQSTGIWLAVKEKGTAVGLGGLAVVFLLLMLCGCSGSNDIGSDWKYSGEYFDSVFKGFPKDEGEIYQHLPRAVGAFGMVFNDSYLPPIKVMQATKKGNLVEIEDSDRVIWVETKRRYEDGEQLDAGYYIRRGTMEYETALGAERTVPRYVEVTDKNLLAKVEKVKQELEAEEEAKEAQRKAEEEAREAQRKAEEEAREAQRKAEEEAKKKAREEAAEQGAYEVDIPIKSLCGFKLGVPPSQVRPLLQNDDGTPVQDFVDEVLKGRWSGDGGCKVTYRLAKPFRLFTHATVSFYDRGVGLHLDQVTLKTDITDVSRESVAKEIAALVELLEKKFGIKFREGGWYSGCDGYNWRGDNDCQIVVFVSDYEGYTLNLELSAYLAISKLDDAAKKARKEAGKKTIVLDATAGADEL